MTTSFMFSCPKPRWARPAASQLMLLALAGLLSACADKPLQLAQPRQELRQELEAAQQAQAQQKATEAARAQAAAAPAPAPIQPQHEAPPPEPRFDLIVNGAPVRDVFLSLVTDTRYSMMVHPAVSGSLSVTLKSVTLREALESLRDVYGFDFKIDGRRITVFPPTMQTRVFTVNYLQQTRVGRSELRVSSGAGPSSTSGGTAGNGSGSNNANTTGAGGTPQQQDGTQVSTSTRNDFWSDTTAALRALIGTEGGRAVIASPQAGTVAVRAMPEEMRHVEAFLKSTKLSVERQVMLEAKIVEVELREGFQSGIDWSVLGKNGAIGQTGVNPSTPTGVGTILNPLVSNSNGLPVLSTAAQNPAWADLIPVASPGGAAFGLALTRGGFQGLISFLESHGDAQILSSPRVATLNNQKAVLKVGSDDYFVTGITSGNNTSSTSTTTNTTNNVIPTLTLTPFFSGIALDVTPQIDEENMITLHIHPAVTAVTEKVKQIDLGTLGNFRLPLASNSMNETDTVVRIPDGAIVAIGGLMQMESNRRGSGLPGSDSNALTATLFGNRANSGRKRELIVLIKPSIIRSAEDWEQHNRSAAQAMSDMDDKARRVITVNGGSTAPAPAPAAAAASANKP
ncbi:secretin N-terminal domain-containing protein [Paucibacter sp. KBW04]|uniref:secretin N-terminal domain-containing protein n=1 Tax=Paucibacter sp. KBW04 TaxID=2153361 RepID=UPI0018CC074E|nr:secretin N-terminal domain-containing protein [Paucibacter sp. KBW04]